MKAKTITPYYGGKFNKTGKYIAQILPKHKYYVAVCGGMEGVLMLKEPSFIEVYNDIDKSLYNLFCVVRDPINCEKLIQKLNLTPYSREELRNCRNTFRVELDPVENARQTYVILSMGFLSSLGNKSFSFGGLKYESSVARGLEYLPSIQNRIKNLILECQDCLEVWKKWDSDKTLVYFDPPYLPNTRVTLRDYTHEMSEKDHLRCLNYAIRCKSKVIISGYFSDMYKEALEDSGKFTRIEIPAWSQGAKCNGKGNESKRTECIWINYSKDEMINPLFQPL